MGEERKRGHVDTEIVEAPRGCGEFLLPPWRMIAVSGAFMGRALELPVSCLHRRSGINRFDYPAIAANSLMNDNRQSPNGAAHMGAAYADSPLPPCRRDRISPFTASRPLQLPALG